MRQPFSPAQITRAVLAVKAAGERISRVEIDHTGGIVVVCVNPFEPEDGEDIDLVAIARGEDGSKGKRARSRRS